MDGLLLVSVVTQAGPFSGMFNGQLRYPLPDAFCDVEISLILEDSEGVEEDLTDECGPDENRCSERSAATAGRVMVGIPPAEVIESRGAVRHQPRKTRHGFAANDRRRARSRHAHVAPCHVTPA